MLAPCAPTDLIDDPNQTRITAGGNLITDYPDKTSTDSAGLETVKIHFNSVLSTPKAGWMGMNISNMYLNMPLDWFEYMRIPYSNFPPDIIQHYDLASKVAANGFIYIEIR